jgi:hypothetical protein
VNVSIAKLEAISPYKMHKEIGLGRGDGGDKKRAAGARRRAEPRG